MPLYSCLLTDIGTANLTNQSGGMLLDLTAVGPSLLTQAGTVLPLNSFLFPNASPIPTPVLLASGVGIGWSAQSTNSGATATASRTERLRI